VAGLAGNAVFVDPFQAGAGVPPVTATWEAACY
jgi:hypothetical protein